jgi:anion-transporting  ArsA/GET3 family ATPase
MAAALALGAAQSGKRALVLTIDPARRLADALGVGALGNEPRAIPREVLTRLGVPAEGALSALMLDMKRTFDDLVERFAESPEARDRILQNRIYQNVSDALAGSAEYSAMEKVFELAESGKFDRLIVDTPPSQHALDFLEAPQRLLEFLDSAIVQLLLHPAFAAGRFGFRVFQRSAHRVLQIIEKVSGVNFLEDVSEFLMAFEGMSEGFRQRAHRVNALLLGRETGFVLAAGPAAESVGHAEAFLARLQTSRVPLVGVVLNRARVWPGGGATPAAVPEAGCEADAVRGLAAALAGSAEADTDAERAARAAIGAASEYASLARRDEEATRALRERSRALGCFWRLVPELPRDIHDLDGLARVAEALFAEEPAGGAHA